MSGLLPLDKLEVQVLVDDVADPLSSVPAYAESEVGYLLRKGKLPVLAAGSMCAAAHGIACVVTAYRGSERCTMLFDAGPEPYALIRNCDLLETDLGAVDGIVLSHGHIDHSGGLLAALDAIQERNGHRQVALYTHPSMFQSRAFMLPNGTIVPIEDIPAPKVLAAHGARVVQSMTSQVVLDGMFFVSGEVPRVTPFEQGLPGHYRRAADGKNWEPDPLIMDEHFLAANVAGKGLIVFSGCAHAGAINILRCARAALPQTPTYGLIGGLHLVGPNEAIIQQTVAALREFRLQVIAAGHCTGWRAMSALVSAFGDEVVTPCAVGKRYVF